MASSRLATFSPNDVTVIITQASTGLSHTVSGFAEDSICSVEQSADRFEMYTGADDTSTRISKSNTSAKVTLPLQQTSNSNDILTLLHVNDVATNNSSGLFSMLIKDNSGRSSFYCEEAYIAVLPQAEFGNSMKTRDWVIHCPKMQTILGGNARFTPEDAAAITQLGGSIPDSWLPN